MDWSALVSLVAVVVAGISVWIGYKERSAGHRQSVYQKQLDGYQAIMSRLFAFYYWVPDNFPMDGVISDKGTWEKAKKALACESSLAHKVLYDHMLFCSQKFFEDSHEALTAWERYFYECKLPVRNNDIWAVTHNTVFDALTTGRKELGVEQLSAEIFNAIGIRPSDEVRSAGNRGSGLRAKIRLTSGFRVRSKKVPH